MKPLAKIFSFLFVLLFLSGCNQTSIMDQDDSKKIEQEIKIISISCDPSLQKIMTAWIDDFNQSYPLIRVTYLDSNSDYKLIPENLLVETEDTGIWSVPVMREGIVPVISSKNPYLQLINEQGIDKESLIRIFSGDRITWGEVLETDAGDTFVVYLPERGKGYNTKWANFLEINVESLQGKRYAIKDSLFGAFRNAPFAIAVLNACCAYYPETNERRDEIAILSIDLNNDGILDKKEKISNDLCEVERALYLGLHPSKLCNCIFLVSDELPAKDEDIVFIKWILTEGQAYVASYGYSILRNSMIEKTIQELDAGRD